MAKRSSGDFERRKNDLYWTWDTRAVKALLPHLAPGTRFIEPCAGDGVLADQPLLRKVVSAGRLKWIEGSKHDGKDNCAWHLFAPGEGTQFIGRP